MDPKSKQIYQKIENFLEERKGRDRRTDEETGPEKVAMTSKAKDGGERRKKQDRRSTNQ